jgi:hypothetical protein
MTFDEVKSDYLKMFNELGQPHDISGSGMECEMEHVVLNPSKTNAKKYMINVIRFAFQQGEEYYMKDNGLYGEEISIHENSFAAYLYDKYIIG